MKPIQFGHLVPVMVACVLLVACDTQPQTPTQTDSPWAPTTTPYDPACNNGCVTIDSFESQHIGDFIVLENQDVDDPVAQWDRCVREVSDCLVESGELSGCVAASACPQECIDAFDAQPGASGDLEAQGQAFEAVFITEGARCVPEEVTL